MKKILIAIAILLVLAGAMLVFAGPKKAVEEVVQTPTTTPVVVAETVVTEGSYSVNAAESTFEWSAQKPLIEGYVNSGTIGVTSGTITVGTSTATGTVALDMNTLTVGLTATKPGKETALETHLKTKDFFDVAKYPTTTIAIKSVAPGADSATTFNYTVVADLTMKGKKNEISFPAKIYLKDGKLHAEAATEIDRTKWGVTFGSGNFFKNLGDNLIDDMVAVSFAVVADKVQ